MSDLTLCRLARSEAEYLMMAPRLAGGWVAVSGDIVDAVERGMAAAEQRDGNWAGYLALLPASWDDAVRRPVTVAQATAILAEVEHAARYPVEEDDCSVADTFAARLRAWISSQAVRS